jgi:hypothetical protein
MGNESSDKRIRSSEIKSHSSEIWNAALWTIVPPGCMCWLICPCPNQWLHTVGSVYFLHLVMIFDSSCLFLLGMAISLSFGFNLALYVGFILALSVGIIFALNVSLSVGTFLVSGQEWSMMYNDSPTELRTTELRTTQLRTTQLRTTPLRTTQLRTTQLRKTQLRTTQLRTTGLRKGPNFSWPNFE